MQLDSYLAGAEAGTIEASESHSACHVSVKPVEKEQATKDVDNI